MKVVTFDCWQTLLVERNWPAAHARRVETLRKTLAEAGRKLSVDEAVLVFDGAWMQHMQAWSRGESSGAAHVASAALETLGIEIDGAARTRLVARWEEASHSGSVEALDGARATLDWVAEAGLGCALVCDTGLTPGRVVRRLLDTVGLLERIEHCVFSDEAGLPKPHPKPFLEALAHFDVAPAEAVHVGDLRRSDVSGARNVGMRSVRLCAEHDDTSDLPEADAVARSHAELRACLAEICSG